MLIKNREIIASVAISAGTLLPNSVIRIDSDLRKWSGGFFIGGGAAATIQGVSVLTRLTSSGLTFLPLIYGIFFSFTLPSSTQNSNPTTD